MRALAKVAAASALNDDLTVAFVQGFLEGQVAAREGLSPRDLERIEQHLEAHAAALDLDDAELMNLLFIMTSVADQLSR